MKKLSMIVLTLVMVLAMSAVCQAAWTVDRVRVDSTQNEVRVLIKNTGNSSLMWVYIPTQLQKEMLATVLSAAAADQELNISVVNNAGKLFFSWLEPCNLAP